MKRLINHQKIYANTSIYSKKFSAADIINFLSGISQLHGFNISTVVEDNGDIYFLIGTDVYNSNGERIELPKG